MLQTVRLTEGLCGMAEHSRRPYLPWWRSVRKKGKYNMIETIAAVGLPVDEVLEIRKNRIMPENARDDMKRISVVTGIHGDELEGQYVCFELQRRIEQEL